MSKTIIDLKKQISDNRSEVVRLEKENKYLTTKMQNLIVTSEAQIKALHNKLTETKQYVGELQATAQKAVKKST